LELNCEIALTYGDCCGRVIEKEKDVLGKIGKEEMVDGTRGFWYLSFCSVFVIKENFDFSVYTRTWKIQEKGRK
jgi:hypothetical protein